MEEKIKEHPGEIVMRMAGGWNKVSALRFEFATIRIRIKTGKEKKSMMLKMVW
jgi:hypothetical protein